tara:strand:+ start:838 stop:1224 length:387 start_codon:yes stop_codon:yes gene_type:complete
MQYFLVVKECIFVLMEIITIDIEKDDVANLDLRKALYLKLINYEITVESIPDFNELEKFDCIPYLKEADNALKTIKNNLIIDHKNRDNYKKVTYPLYLKTETFINFLKINDSKWDLIKFLNSHSFKTK